MTADQWQDVLIDLGLIREVDIDALHTVEPERFRELLMVEMEKVVSERYTDEAVSKMNRAVRDAIHKALVECER